MKRAFFDQHHDGDADDGFGHRGDPKHRARGHRLLGLQVHHTLLGVMNDFALARDDRHGTGDVASGDAPLDHLVDSLEALGRKSHFLRLVRR